MSKIKIFFSYTLYDRVLNKSYFMTMKHKFSETKFIDTYIDLLDNTSNDPQSFVYKQLSLSTCLCAIMTPSLLSSQWVQKELQYADFCDIPKLFASVDDIDDIIRSTTEKELLTCRLIDSLIKITQNLRF